MDLKVGHYYRDVGGAFRNDPPFKVTHKDNYYTVIFLYNGHHASYGCQYNGDFQETSEEEWMIYKMGGY
jgi:hypothetical protein